MRWRQLHKRELAAVIALDIDCFPTGGVDVGVLSKWYDASPLFFLALCAEGDETPGNAAGFENDVVAVNVTVPVGPAQWKAFVEGKVSEQELVAVEIGAQKSVGLYMYHLEKLSAAVPHFGQLAYGHMRTLCEQLPLTVVGLSGLAVTLAGRRALTAIGYASKTETQGNNTKQ